GRGIKAADRLSTKFLTITIPVLALGLYAAALRLILGVLCATASGRRPNRVFSKPTISLTLGWSSNRLELTIAITPLFGPPQRPTHRPTSCSDLLKVFRSRRRIWIFGI